MMNHKVDGRAFLFGYDHKTPAGNGKTDIVERRRRILFDDNTRILCGKPDGFLQMRAVLLIGIRNVRFDEEIRQREP